MKKPKPVGSTLPKRDANVIFNRRAALLSFAGAGVMGAIAFRMGQLQVSDLVNRQYTLAADENRFDTRIVPPPRGIIYDRFGTALAQTSKDYQVAIMPSEVENLEDVLGRVAQILGLDAEWARRAGIRVRGGSRYEPQPVREGLTWDEFNAINVRLPELPGVMAMSADVRRYPHGIVYGNPIGYVQKPAQRDIDRALENPEQGQTRAMYLRNPHVRIGRAGLEAQMETALHGQPGYRKVIVNARGVEQGEDASERRDAVRGQGLVLTLDHELQRTGLESFGEHSGSAVVMDIYTGDLLAMVSAPGFDPNLFVNGISQTDFRGYNEDEKRPLYHKAVTGVYAPGSTFKMIVAIAAKQAGMADDFHVNCPGYFSYGGRAFHCWRRGGHGRVNMRNAMKGSCNVFHYQAALIAGPERIANVARQFGFGHAFDVSVPGVVAGLVPDPVWWRENRNEGWTGGLTLNYGVGQGALQITPLQLAVVAARIGNNGRAVTPRLIREGAGMVDPPAPPNMSEIAPEHLAAIRDGMFGVCNEGGGTALSAGNLGLVYNPETGVAEPEGPHNRGWPRVQLAGKTGTAQVRALTAATRGQHYSTIEWRYRDNALFCCFGPYHDARYACAVVVEHGGAGSAVAGPIARRIMRETILRDPARRAPARLATLEPSGRQA